MYYKLKYSSLLHLEKKKNSVLHLKGPLGKNYIKIPPMLKIKLDRQERIITFRSIGLKRSILPGFLSIFKNKCRTLVFGDLISLNIQGLGLKFLKITELRGKDKYLSMSLGYSDPVYYLIDTNCSIFFFKDIRNISIYSADYAFLRNQSFSLVSLKKPNKFRKRENGITISSTVF